MTKETIQTRKQQLVRNAIHDAAIELFAVKGFDETTVEEVAQGAGVSRRSFFRYFASKDDLLAQNVMLYGDLLTAAINACPAAFTPFEVVRETVLTVVKQIVGHAHTRQVLDISERSPSARQAHVSRLREIEDAVALAFATRLKSASEYDAKPRVLASLTLSIMSNATMLWYRREYKDPSVAASEVIAMLTGFVSEAPTPTQSEADVETGRKREKSTRVRQSVKVKR